MIGLSINVNKNVFVLSLPSLHVPLCHPVGVNEGLEVLLIYNHIPDHMRRS